MPDAQDVICALLDKRGADKTICPSEVARAMAGPQGDWREAMDSVHTAVDAMLASGRIDVSWRGKVLGERRGAYRIARRSTKV